MKMNRLATFAALGALLVAAPSFATDADPSTDQVAVSAAVPQVEKAPERRRQTTLERWRGGPKRAAHSDSLIRQEALDKTLPIVTHTATIAATPTF
jgi:hypothetical protein